MLTIFPGYTTRHYGYLRDSQPDLVPHLDIEKVDVNIDHRRTEEEGEELVELLGLVLKQSLANIFHKTAFLAIFILPGHPCFPWLLILNLKM